MSEKEKRMASVQEFKASGKSQRVWCTEKGIKRGTLRYWIERTEILSIGSKIKFAELMIAGEAE